MPARGQCDPAKTISALCPVCGKEYTYFRSQPRKTCSIDCYKRQHEVGEKAQATCGICGKVFEYTKLWPRKWCSEKCSSKAKRKSTRKKPLAPRIQARCEQCGKEFRVTLNAAYSGRFCSHPCAMAWAKSHRPPHLPPPLIKICTICGKEYKTKASEAAKRVTCGSKCNGIWQREYGPRGEDHPSWNGGGVAYYGPNWRSQRKAARRRDGYACQRCGITEAQLGQALDVHHIRRFNDCMDHLEANHLDNLICLCRTCHCTVEPRRKSQTDFDA